MGTRIRARPNNPRLERPRDAVSEAQIEAMRVKLSQRCETAGRSVVSAAVCKPTATAGGGTPLPLDFEALAPSTRPAPNYGSSEAKSGTDQLIGPNGMLFPGGVPSSTAAALQWDTPVVSRDDLTGYVKDTTGAYSIVKERLSDGTYRYLAFHGSAVLAPACASLECARAHCQAAAERA